MEAKPCPFCGRPPVVTEDDSYGMCAVLCTCEAAPAVQRLKGQLPDAIDVWNRRAADTQPAVPSEAEAMELADDLDAQSEECCDTDDADAMCHRCGLRLNAAAALRALATLQQPAEPQAVLPSDRFLRPAISPIVNDAFKRARRMVLDAVPSERAIVLPDDEPFVSAIIATIRSMCRAEPQARVPDAELDPVEYAARVLDSHDLLEEADKLRRLCGAPAPTDPQDNPAVSTPAKET